MKTPKTLNLSGVFELKTLNLSGGSEQNTETSTSGKIRMTILTGAPIPDWSGLLVVDLSTIRINRPTLVVDYNHNENEIIGKCSGFSTDSGGLTAEGEILSFTETDRAAEVLYKLSRGIPYEVSSLLDCEEATEQVLLEDQTALVNGMNVTGPLTIIRNAMLRGVTVCPYARDKDTGIEKLKRNWMEKEFMKKDIEQNEDTKGKNKACSTGASELEKFINEFGLEQGVEYFRRGMTLEESQADDYAVLKAARKKFNEEGKKNPSEEGKKEPDPNEELGKKMEELKANVATLENRCSQLEKLARRGEGSPLSNVPADTMKPKKHPMGAIFGMAEKIRQQTIKKQ